MNVLLVWSGPETAGERAILARRELALLAALAEHGIRVTVALCGDGGELGADLRAAGIDVHLLPMLPPRLCAVRNLPGAVLRLRALIARLQPEIVEATEPMPAIAAGLAAWPRGKTGVLLYRRQHGGGRARSVLASRLAARLSDRTLVSSDAMRRQAAIEDRCALERIEVAHPGTADPLPVSPFEVSAARRSLGISESAQVIAAVSRLRWEKGIDVLIRSLRYLAGDGDVHLIVAGSGPEEARLRELAAESPVPVHFLGHRDDVALWLHVADVVTIPSRRESFGRVTLETMAAGRPLVAARVGGLAEAIVDGESGVLVPPEDEESLATAIRTMLADRALARRRGESARERFRERYTIAHMAAARRGVWERALAGAGSR